MAILILLVIPFLATLISNFIFKKVKWLEYWALAASTAEFLVAIYLIQQVVLYKIVNFLFYFTLDSMGALMLFSVVVVNLLATYYAVGYLRQQVEKNVVGFRRVKECYLLMHAFMQVLLIAIMTTNPIVMWIAVEATTLSTAFLISFYNKPTDIEAAWKYLIINSVGLLLGLLGTLIYLALYSVSSNTDFVRWNDLIAAAPSLPTGIIKFGFIFIVIGYGTKLGLVPMHTWRPDAYSRAPVPVVTLLSGALLNVALLAILRFKMITDAAVGTGFSSSVFIFMGVITLVFVGLIMLTQRNYRRMLAYSSIEHAGMMMLGFGFGGIGIFAAFLHSIYHAIAKSILFLGAGNINMKYDSAEFKDIKGVLSKMPITAIATLFGFIAITGIPPLGIFMTKFYVILTAFSHAPFIAAIMLVSLVLVFIGMFKAIFHMVFDQGPTTIPAGEINVWTIAPLVVAMVLLAILSVYIPDTLRILLNDAVHLFN